MRKKAASSSSKCQALCLLQPVPLPGQDWTDSCSLPAFLCPVALFSRSYFDSPLSTPWKEELKQFPTHSQAGGRVCRLGVREAGWTEKPLVAAHLMCTPFPTWPGPASQLSCSSLMTKRFDFIFPEVPHGQLGPSDICHLARSILIICDVLPKQNKD